MPWRFSSLPPAYRSAFYHACWATPLAVVLGLSLAHPTLVTRLQDPLFDLYQRAAPRDFDPAVPVRIVDIDDRSIAEIGQWPWPRTRIADLVARLAAAKAAAIAFDIVFSEPDRTSADAFVSGLRDDETRTAVRTALKKVPSNDAVLADALGGANVVLGAVLTRGSPAPRFEAPYGVAVAGDDPTPFLPEFSGALVPLPNLIARAAGLGALNWLPDSDQIVRRVPLMLRLENRLVPGLAMESLRVAQGASTFVVRTSNASGDARWTARPGLDSVRVGAITVPATPAGDLRLRFTSHRDARFISAAAVLAGRFDPAEIADRIVLVGSSSAGLTDIRATPIDPVVPGVEIQAQALEGLLTNTRLVRPDWTWVELLAGALLASALALALPLVRATVGAGLAAATLAIFAALSWFAFTRHQLLVDPLAPGAMVAAAYVGGMSALFRAEQRGRRFVQDAFGRFVSPEVVSRLARDPARLTLGGELRPLTVMFTDLRNFSTIAERMSAQDLTRFMNRYLSPMSEIVLARRGTVDKYVGDAIMAFWNAPLSDADHATHAAEAALAMVEMLPALGLALVGETGQALPPLRCGIGLASGPCVVGNLGSDLRLDYSALGDDVNLASRLESLTKAYGLDILAAESTRQLAPSLAWLDVDDVVVVGRSVATRVATLLGDASHARTDAFVTLEAAHQAMLVDYRGGRFQAALSSLPALRASAPGGLSTLYDIYEDRCRTYVAQPPTSGWDAVTRMAHK